MVWAEPRPYVLPVTKTATRVLQAPDDGELSHGEAELLRQALQFAGLGDPGPSFLGFHAFAHGR